ncbi:MAG: HD domain-containing protein [Candidatus Saccharimonadales bacterium]
MMKRDIELLFELGMLRHLPRQWNRFGGINFASLAEHHFRVAWIALLISKYEGGDNEKILKMALAHDIAESRTNDVDYIARQYTKRNEELALSDMLQDTKLNDEFTELMHEYEERTSLEAKIVKDADNLDVDFELQEQAANGVSIGEVWGDNRKTIVREKLYTETAKNLFDELKKSNPHDWHHTSPRNRTNGGDWKK